MEMSCAAELGAARNGLKDGRIQNRAIESSRSEALLRQRFGSLIGEAMRGAIEQLELIIGEC